MTSRSPDILIDVLNAQTIVTNIDRKAVIDLATRVLEAQGVDRAEISIAIVDDSAIHELNRKHLQHDWPTDVITFPLSEPGDLELSGELVISAETASRTAAAAGLPIWPELALYLVHGLLHLNGFDDVEVEDAGKMRRREAELLEAEGLINTFPLADASTSSAADRRRESAGCSR